MNHARNAGTSAFFNSLLVTVWRDDDAATAAENRRRAAGKAALARSQKRGPKAAPAPVADSSREQVPAPKLRGWEEFAHDELLR
jgi:hypothetical protein